MSETLTISQVYSTIRGCCPDDMVITIMDQLVGVDVGFQYEDFDEEPGVDEEPDEPEAEEPEADKPKPEAAEPEVGEPESPKEGEKSSGIEAVRAQITKLFQTRDHGEATSILQSIFGSYDAENVSSLNPTFYPEVIEDIEDAIRA
jgi:predicted lipid-binding transport protein (Tim44 family)